MAKACDALDTGSGTNAWLSSNPWTAWPLRPGMASTCSGANGWLAFGPPEYCAGWLHAGTSWKGMLSSGIPNPSKGKAKASWNGPGANAWLAS